VNPPFLWRQIQRQNFRRLDLLADFLELSSEQRSHLLDRLDFSLNLPRRLAQKIAKQTLDDPIFRQFVPLLDEMNSPSGFSLDPVGDLPSCCCPKLLHKYYGRALLLTTGGCAMHCRYCFRQNFPYVSPTSGFTEEIQAIESDPTIQEIVLSGGDPLSLSNASLGSLLASLARIPHLRRVRFHTRFPIGIPERLDDEFIQILSTHPQQIIFVLHVNHPREIDADILNALRPLQRLGIPILCQTVLLKGVNDDEETLLALCEKLINAAILPYYLHLLDRVKGSAHFDVPEHRGCQLIQYLHTRLSGYGVPKLVRETAGEPGKTVIFR
jgi:EF-P beta-lysylation protein EpmB